MRLLHLYDRATLPAACDLPLDPELNALIVARVAHLAAEGLPDFTEFIVVTGETVAVEVIAAIGVVALDRSGWATTRGARFHTAL